MSRISLDNVSLTFHLRQRGRVPLKEFVVRQMFRKSRNPITEVKALRGLNVEAREGDRVGIIGHNGAGKSTLLKLLAGVYPPTSGVRDVVGHISSLFELTLGFEMEANGWENIAFRSYLQGETPKTVRSKVEAIAEFSELGEFLDMPVRYYSSGMLVRLAFSIATSIEPEILLVDEVLSAGDMSFQDKARARMYSMMDKAKIIVMVSHDMRSIANICNRVLWLDHGAIRMEGRPEEVIHHYAEHMHKAAKMAA